MNSKLTALNRASDNKKILVYYFAFPHYRIAILKELKSILGDKLDLFSGVQSRSGLNPLTKQDLPDLEVFETKLLGPFSWEHKVVGPAISSKYSAVVLGPAVASLSTWAILTVRRLLGRKTYLWGQCGQPGSRSLKRVLQEIMNRMATGLLVYGSYEESGARELGISAKKVHRIRNSVPLIPLPLTQSELTERLDSDLEKATQLGDLRLVYVGRVQANKHVGVLLEAGDLLKGKFEKLSIRIVGEGPEKEALRSQYPDSRYEFLGGIYDPGQLQSELANATFVVAPWKMGLLAIDALSVGTPAMIPDNPVNGSEFEALTPGINGFNFEFGNAEDLAYQIEEAISKLARVSSSEYFESREKGLRDWSPEMVAKNIAGVIE